MSRSCKALLYRWRWRRHLKIVPWVENAEQWQIECISAYVSLSVAQSVECKVEKGRRGGREGVILFWTKAQSIRKRFFFLFAAILHWREKNDRPLLALRLSLSFHYRSHFPSFGTACRCQCALRSVCYFLLLLFIYFFFADWSELCFFSSYLSGTDQQAGKSTGHHQPGLLSLYSLVLSSAISSRERDHPGALTAAAAAASVLRRRISRKEQLPHSSSSSLVSSRWSALQKQRKRKDFVIRWREKRLLLLLLFIQSFVIFELEIMRTSENKLTRLESLVLLVCFFFNVLT